MILISWEALPSWTNRMIHPENLYALVGTSRSIAQKDTPVPHFAFFWGVEVGGFRGRYAIVAQGDSNPLAWTSEITDDIYNWITMTLNK